MRCTLWCRVIDNFGDAGVAWRLAKSLSQEFHWRVRLMIDRPETLAAFVPQCPAAAADADVFGINVRRWTDASGDREAADVPDVTVETFSCRLPDAVEAAIAHRFDAGIPTAVFALDYLTAETYAEESNNLVSRHPRWGYPKTFLFPGFTPKTAGVVREDNAGSRRETFTPEKRRDFLTRYGADPAAPFTLFFFTYPENPVESLVHAVVAAGEPIQVLLAPGEASRRFKAAVEKAGTPAFIRTVELPMLPQADFDDVLLASDACLVRGEDSTLRVQLSGVPLLWTLYPQTEETHLVKMRAFAEKYSASFPSEARAAWLAMEEGLNARGITPEVWRAWKKTLPDEQKGALLWRENLLKQQTAAQTVAQIAKEKLEY